MSTVPSSASQSQWIWLNIWGLNAAFHLIVCQVSGTHQANNRRDSHCWWDSRWHSRWYLLAANTAFQVQYRWTGSPRSTWRWTTPVQICLSKQHISTAQQNGKCCRPNIHTTSIQDDSTAPCVAQQWVLPPASCSLVAITEFPLEAREPFWSPTLI